MPVGDRRLSPRLRRYTGTIWLASMAQVSQAREHDDGAGRSGVVPDHQTGQALTDRVMEMTSAVLRDDGRTGSRSRARADGSGEEPHGVVEQHPVEQRVERAGEDCEETHVEELHDASRPSASPNSVAAAAWPRRTRSSATRAVPPTCSRKHPRSQPAELVRSKQGDSTSRQASVVAAHAATDGAPSGRVQGRGDPSASPRSSLIRRCRPAKSSRQPRSSIMTVAIGAKSP